MSIKFYYIDQNYLASLSALDSRIYLKSNRPYIGIIFKIADLHFFAPLSSPKPKHARLKKPSVYKMHESNDPNKPLGIININNMIPVPLDKVSLVDMTQVDRKYYWILQAQLRFIKSNQDDIKSCAETLYYKAKAGHPISAYCLDFQKLEDYCKSIKTD